MKVVKFGGSSLADDVRFQSVAEIIGEQATIQTTTAILSAPKGVTNRLVELCDVAESGASYSELLSELQKHLLNICEQAGFSQTLDLISNVDEAVAEIGSKLEGVRLLRHCPIITTSCLYCPLSIQLMIFSKSNWQQPDWRKVRYAWLRRKPRGEGGKVVSGCRHLAVVCTFLCIGNSPAGSKRFPG